MESCNFSDGRRNNRKRCFQPVAGETIFRLRSDISQRNPARGRRGVIYRGPGYFIRRQSDLLRRIFRFHERPLSRWSAEPDSGNEINEWRLATDFAQPRVDLSPVVKTVQRYLKQSVASVVVAGARPISRSTNFAHATGSPCVTAALVSVARKLCASA